MDWVQKFNEKFIGSSDLLLICPTRGRVDKAKEMYSSVLNTSNVDLLFLLDKDDECLEEYRDVFNKTAYCISDRMPITDYINIAYDMFNQYNFYSVTNDDFYYHTPGWDDILSNKGLISYGNDKMNGARLPTTSVIDGNIIRALGWLQMPRLYHLYGDVVWRDIGTNLGILDYHKEVITEHRHYMNRKSDKDSTYNFTNSKEMYERDDQAYVLWRMVDMKKDISKVKEVI